MKSAYRITAFFLVAVLLFSVSACGRKSRIPAPEEGAVHVTFLDVGQADCAVIRTTDAVIVVDTGGERSDGEELLAYLRRADIQKIDLLVLTHPHEDHVGGASSLLSACDVEECLMPELLEDSTAFRKCVSALEAEGCKVTRATAGDLFEYGGLSVDVLSPNKAFYTSLNDGGAIIRARYKEFAFLFMADASEVVEQELLDLYPVGGLDADILKVAHHGSSTSTSAAFLAAVMPQYAVISCAADNEYGFPHADVLLRLASFGVKVYRTDTAGTVAFAAKDGEISIIEED